MHQTNRYFYSEDNIVEKTFSHLYDASLPYGLQVLGMDNIYKVFETGHAVFQSVKVSPERDMGVEIFFINENLRLSAIIIYNKSDLVPISIIREDLTGFPSQQWSTETDQVPERDFRGNWKGTYTTMECSPQRTSDPEHSQFKWGWEGNTSFYYPDGVSISCPKTLGTNSPIKMVVNWLVNDRKMQQVIVEFNKDGHGVSRRLNLYELESDLA